MEQKCDGSRVRRWTEGIKDKTFVIEGILSIRFLE
jgi:hypothetical protein